MERIKSLSQSPCYACPYTVDCSNKIKRNPRLGDIRENMWKNTEGDRARCVMKAVLEMDKNKVKENK